MKKLKFVVFLLLFFHLSKAFAQYEGILPQGIYTSDFNIDNRPRLITYYMPLNYGKKDLYPLVVVLHDVNSSAKGTIKSLGDILHAKADSGNCVVLYPDAVAAHWNNKTGASSPALDSVNDVGFISIMVDFFVQQYKCDPERLYVIGAGSGGDMAKLLYCSNTKKYAAIASINGSKAMPCTGSTAANTLELNAPVKEAIVQSLGFCNETSKAVMHPVWNLGLLVVIIS